MNKNKVSPLLSNMARQGGLAYPITVNTSRYRPQRGRIMRNRWSIDRRE